MPPPSCVPRGSAIGWREAESCDDDLERLDRAAVHHPYACPVHDFQRISLSEKEDGALAGVSRRPDRLYQSFDEQGRPVAKEPGHGIGVRSIAAYCEKHGAYCIYEVSDGLFEVYITHM